MADVAPLIEDLFHQGHSLEHILGIGLDTGWTRDDVMTVLRERGWDLDGSGRLPRSKRMTIPRGLRGLPPAAPVKTTSTTSRHRTTVPDRLDGHPLPTEPPTPAEAMAEQAALDVPVGNPSAASAPVAALSVGKLTAGSLSADVTVPDGERWLPPLDDARLPEMAASVTITPLELATQIREQVDRLAPRANPDGTVNASHVAMEQTLRERSGLVSYFAELDGPGKFLPDPPMADWEMALVADPFDPEHPALQVPDGFVPGGTDEDAPLSAPPPSPEPSAAPTSPRPPLDQRSGGLAGRDLDEWLDDAGRSPSKAVQLIAGRCALLHEQLHDALDDLVRAEYAHAREQA